MRAVWRAIVPASTSTFSNVVRPDLALLDRDAARPVGRRVEGHEEGLAGPILVEGDRFRRAGIGVGHRAGLALERRVPVAEGQVVEVRRGDLLGREDHVVVLGPAGDEQGAVDEADPPRPAVAGGVEPGERARRGALRGEHPAVDDRVDDRQVDLRRLRGQDRDELVGGRQAGDRGEVVGAVDRGPVVDVVGAGDDDRPDPGVGEALELGRDALHRAARLGVRIEQVAGDEEEIDLLDQREVDGRPEGCELTLPLRRRLVSQVRMARPEMDVRGMDEA